MDQQLDQCKTVCHQKINQLMYVGPEIFTVHARSVQVQVTAEIGIANLYLRKGWISTMTMHGNGRQQHV